MNINNWLKNNVNNLKGKRVVISGATGGLGKELCFILAELEADITLLCRNKQKADSLINEIKSVYAFVNIDFIELDFEDLNSVKNCVSSLKKYKGIDILINNAGVYNVPVKTLDSGFNNIFQINFLYPYYLTKMLLLELEKKENSTCIVVSSIAHNYSKIDKNDIDFSTRKRASKIYGNAKRFLTFSMFELFKTSKVNLSVVHPGVTLTNMTNHYPKLINPVIKFAIKLFFPNPKKAALNIIFGTSHKTNYHEWIGPKFFNVWGKPKLKKLSTCKKQESEKIYEIAESLFSKIK